MSSGYLTLILVLFCILGLLFGATWVSLIIGILAMFSGVWWIGTMEKEGNFS